MLTVLLSVYIVAIILFTIRILLRDDLSPPTRLAWFIVLMLLPYVGGVIYLMFGEINLGNRANEAHDRIIEQIRDTAKDEMGGPENVAKLINPLYQPAFFYAGSINGFYPFEGNKAELMVNAEATRKSMVADIDASKDHVHVLSYIWLNDQTGTDIANALIRAVGRGVVCRAMADGLGSRVMVNSTMWQQMKDAGVQLVVAMPLTNLLNTVLTSRIDLRNHRKITVIDGLITYCGSRNLADPEYRVKPKYAPWVDIMMRFKGPVVAQNQILFASDWMQATGELLDNLKLLEKPRKGGFPAQVMGDGPTERKGATPQFLSTMIACSQFKITLSTPYFVPDATVLEALCAAAHRGVEVVLIFPENNDSWIVAAASRSYYRKLLEAGCIIHEYVGGLLHAKTFTADGLVTFIGSSNLDLRSFDLNYENNILLQDTETTNKIIERQHSYIEHSKSILLSDVLNWSLYKRIWNNAIATVGPIL